MTPKTSTSSLVGDAAPGADSPPVPGDIFDDAERWRRDREYGEHMTRLYSPPPERDYAPLAAPESAERDFDIDYGGCDDGWLWDREELR